MVGSDYQLLKTVLYLCPHTVAHVPTHKCMRLLTYIYKQNKERKTKFCEIFMVRLTFVYQVQSD